MLPARHEGHLDRMDLKARDELAVRFGHIASEAGKVIMAVQASDLGARRKADGSPVCHADIKAEELILARVAAILSSESKTPLSVLMGLPE